jgi:hypothetical protein
MVLLQDPQPYNSAAMARRIDGTLKQVMSLTSHVQVCVLLPRCCWLVPVPA